MLLFKAYFLNIVYGGVTSGLDKLEKQRIILVNQVLLVFIFLASPYFFIFRNLGLFIQSYLVIPSVASYVVCILLNRYKFYAFAALGVIFTNSIILFYYSSVLGQNSGAHYVYFTLVLLPFILINHNKHKFVILGFLFPVLSVLLLEISQFQLWGAPIVNDRQAHIIAIFATITTVLIAISSTLFYHYSKQTAYNQLNVAYQELKQKQKIDKELLMAKDIQLKMLPLKPFQLPNYVISQYYQAANVIGGDFLDYVALNERKMVIMVADIVGKGIPASLMTQALKTVMDSTLKGRPSSITPTEIMNELNQLFDGHATIQRHVPMVLGILDNVDNTFTYANAGHEPALLLKADGTIKELTVGGSPLGMNFGMDPEDIETYDAETISLTQGDKLILITDGFTDILNENGDRFDHIQFQTLIQKHKHKTGKEFIRAVVDDCNSYQDIANQADDMTMILVEREG